jgi:hypothetical protein
MSSSISLPSFSAKTSNILNPDGTSIDQSFAPTNGGMFRNRVINGNFDIWQRGTTQSVGGYGSVDRFSLGVVGSSAVVSRQTHALGQTDVPNNPKYFCRLVTTSVAGAGNLVNFNQSIEGVSNFAGQTVTVSFYAKADAARPISVECTQIFGTGGSPSAAVEGVGVKNTLSTTWARYTLQLAIPSISGKTLGTNGDDSLQLKFWLDAGSSFNTRTNTLGQQSGTFDIDQVQIEAGSSATPFEVRPIGVETQLCQRYFYSAYNSSAFSAGAAGTVNLVYLIYHLPVVPRIAPTISFSGITGGNTFSISDQFATDFTTLTPSIFTQPNALFTGVSGRIFIDGFTGLTVGRWYGGCPNGSTSARTWFSMEL